MAMDLKQVEELRDACDCGNRRIAPEVMEGLMQSHQAVHLFVNDVLAESAALRDLLAKIGTAKDVKAAKALAAKAAKIPAVEDPRIVMKRRRAQEAEMMAECARQMIERQKADAKARKIEAAKKELARIEAQRRSEAELKAYLEDAGIPLPDEGEVLREMRLLGAGCHLEV